MKRTILLLGSIAIACSNAVPPTSEFLLRAEPATRTGRVEATTRVVIERVTVAPYLRRAGIVVELEPGQLRAATRNEWAEPLDASFEDLIGTVITRDLGFPVVSSTAATDDGQVGLRIEIDRFHGTLDGRAMLEARYWISDRRRPTSQYEFSESTDVVQPGYPGLVAAERVLANRLAVAIALAIGEGSN